MPQSAPNLFAQILDGFLFGGGDGYLLAVDLPDDSRAGEAVRPVGLDALQVPEAVERVLLPPGEDSLEALPAVLRQCKGDRPIYFVPGWEAPRALTSQFVERYPGLGLQEASIEALLKYLAPKRRFGVLIPPGTLTLRRLGPFREWLLSSCHVDGVVYHWDEHGLPVHHAMRLVSLFCEAIGDQRDAARVTRFFAPPGSSASEQEVLEDLDKLLLRAGGRTEYGYVHRERIVGTGPITFEKFDPREISHRADVARLGESARLGSMVQFVPTALSAADERRLALSDEASGGTVAVVTGRTVFQGRVGDYEVRVSGDRVQELHHLQPGDICVARLVKRSPAQLAVYELTEDDVPAIASDGIHVLRPASGTTREHRQVLVAFLASEVCARALAAEGVGLMVSRAALEDLRVPVPDEDLTIALRSIDEAHNLFVRWQDDTKKARSRLFAFRDVQDARLHVLTSGAAIRQRAEVAALVDDPAFRVRTRYPHPVSFRWRTVEAANPDAEGYMMVLEAAEATVAFLAALAVTLARGQNVELKRLADLARRLSGTGARGISFGDWRSVLNEVSGSRFKDLPAATPFYELTALGSEPGAAEAIATLAEARNAQAHGRGPKGAAVQPAFYAARDRLLALLVAVEFIADYPLRYVEHSRWDSLERVSVVEYRDLTGDHPLGSLGRTTVAGQPVETGSLYAEDRRGDWLLLRPLLNRHACPECGHLSTFMLDAFDPRSRTCTLKSLEDGHVHHSQDVATIDSLRRLGLLAV